MPRVVSLRAALQPLPETEVSAMDLAALVCALLGRHNAPAYTAPVLWDSVW